MHDEKQMIFTQQGILGKVISKWLKIHRKLYSKLKS